MARFDLYHNPNEDTAQSTPYVVDIQSDHVGVLPTRIVIPLRRLKSLGYSGSPSDLLPVITINSEGHFLDTPAMAAVPFSYLGRPVANLEKEGYRKAIEDAKERLFGAH